MTFQEDFQAFAVSTGVPFSIEGGVDHDCPIFHFSKHSLNVKLVPLSAASSPIRWDRGITYLFEDRWHTSRELLEKRLLAHLGEFKSIFARKCEIFKPSPQECREFLERWHIYGYARCKYRYALRYEGQTVAVSTFSAPRPMMRSSRQVQSYEWVRFASIADLRISGGMGRLLEAFVRECQPQDIMSYADLEWSDGSVYETLGFELAGYVDPVAFVVNPVTWERRHLVKVEREGDIPNDALIIRNLGSAKFIKLF